MIYLDNHATTRCDPAVVDKMLPYFSDVYGNAASRSHSAGMRARAGVELARKQVAALIGADASEIVFTSGATEANNLAVLGVARAVGRGHVVTSAIEHKAVLDPVAQLEREGFTVTRVSVDETGCVRAEDVIAALQDDTVLVSLMRANNEVGTLQPVAEVGAACRERGIPLHTDAAQAIGKVSIDVSRDHIDLLSLSAHKFYGPKGIGALYVRRGRPRIVVEPLLYGGGHERGLRSGTLPVPLCVGLGAASELCRAELAGDAMSELGRLRDRLLDGLLAIDGVRLNGARSPRLPNNINIAVDGVESAALMMGMRSIAMSSGSACSSETRKPSHVLRAMGLPAERVHQSVRLGLGRFTTEDEVTQTLDTFRQRIPELRALTP